MPIHFRCPSRESSLSGRGADPSLCCSALPSSATWTVRAHDRLPDPPGQRATRSVLVGRSEPRGRLLAAPRGRRTAHAGACPPAACASGVLGPAALCRRPLPRQVSAGRDALRLPAPPQAIKRANLSFSNGSCGALPRAVYTHVLITAETWFIYLCFNYCQASVCNEERETHGQASVADAAHLPPGTSRPPGRPPSPLRAPARRRRPAARTCGPALSNAVTAWAPLPAGAGRGRKFNG